MLLSGRPRGRASERRLSNTVPCAESNIAGSWRRRLRRRRSTPRTRSRRRRGRPTGPSQGDENAGGRRSRGSSRATARSAATAPATSHARARGAAERPRGGDQERGADRRAAASSDQRGSALQAPNAPEPGPNRLHGSTVARTATAKAARATDLARGPGSRLADLGYPGVRAEHAREALGAEDATADRRSRTRGTSGGRTRRTARRPGSPGAGRIARTFDAAFVRRHDRRVPPPSAARV